MNTIWFSLFSVAKIYINDRFPGAIVILALVLVATGVVAFVSYKYVHPPSLILDDILTDPALVSPFYLSQFKNNAALVFVKEIIIVGHSVQFSCFSGFRDARHVHSQGDVDGESDAVGRAATKQVRPSICVNP